MRWFTSVISIVLLMTIIVTSSVKDAITTVYIGNLPYEVSAEEVEDVFGEYGPVKNVYLPTDRETGKTRGFGFVEMENEADEQNAIYDLNEADWMGRKLRVNKAKPRPNKGGRR